MHLLKEDLPVLGYELALDNVKRALPEKELLPDFAEDDPKPIRMESILSHRSSIRSELNRISYDASWSSLLERTATMNSKRLKGVLLTGLQPHSRRAACLIPNKFNNTVLGNDSYKMIARYGIGAEVWRHTSLNSPSLHGRPNPPCPFCNSAMDSFGDHASFCARSALRTQKHNDLRNLNGKQASASGATVVKELRGLVNNRGDRPADNHINDISGIIPNTSLWIDYTIPSPFAAHCFDESCSVYGAATDKSANKKLSNAADVARLSDARFIPFVIATTGGFHDSALDVVELLAQARSTRWNLNLNQVRQLVIDQIAVCVQRGNARMWQEATCSRSGSRAHRGVS